MMGRNYEAHTCFHDPILGPYVVSSSSQKEEFFSKLLSSAATAGGAMSLFTGVGGGAGLEDSASAGGTGRALLVLTPHNIAVCLLMQVFTPPTQAGRLRATLSVRICRPPQLPRPLPLHAHPGTPMHALACCPSHN